MQNDTKQTDAQRDGTQPSSPDQVEYDPAGGRVIAYMLIGFALLLVAALWIGMQK